MVFHDLSTCLGVETYSSSFSAYDGAVRGGYEERFQENTKKGFAPINAKEVKCFVQFSGKFWEALSAEDEYEFLCQLKAAGFGCTRIDCAIDIHADVCPFTWEQIEECQEKDNYAGFKQSKKIVSKKLGEQPMPTYYFGSRLSDKLLRIYPHGGIPRLELECKGSAARDVFSRLTRFNGTNTPRVERINAFLQQITDFVFNCIVFCDREQIETKDGVEVKKYLRASRAPAFPWWIRLSRIVSSGFLRVSPRISAAPQYKRSRAWVERQVRTTLWLLKEFHERQGMPSSWLFLDSLVQEIQKNPPKYVLRKLQSWLTGVDLQPCFS
jgi:hypothetical protein